MNFDREMLMIDIAARNVMGPDEVFNVEEPDIEEIVPEENVPPFVIFVPGGGIQADQEILIPWEYSLHPNEIEAFIRDQYTPRPA